MYKGSWRLGNSCPKTAHQNQLNIYFMTSRQDWVGMAKLHKSFHQDNLKFRDFLSTEFSILIDLRKYYSLTKKCLQTSINR